MANAHSFPLIRLPNLARSRVLQCMNGLNLLLISLISRKSKVLVKSLQIKPSEFHITIGHQLTLSLFVPNIRLHFYVDSEENMRMLEKPKKVRMTIASDMGRIIGNIEMENPLDLKDWFCHLCDVFNILKASHMFIAPGSDEIDVGAIQNTFPKFETLQIERVSPRQSKNVLEAFYQDVEVLKINSNPFGKNEPLYRKILIQNYDNLHLGCLPPREKFELNDLLMCNSISINYHTIQNFKGINQFLKLWMKGCNPRLRELCISQRNLNPEDVLKGVRGSENIPEEEDIMHNNEVLFRGYHDVLPSVAIEISRFDGTKAAVCMIGGTFWLLVENN